MESQRGLQRTQLALTYDQVDNLQLLANRINRQRDKSAEGAEVITTSALVRCALELFLAAQDDLSGNNERDILNSYLDKIVFFSTQHSDRQPK